MKKFELLAASALAMFCATPSFAQTTAPAPAQDTAPAVDEADDADIVVTASKRETTLLDTPIAVSVVSSKTIQDAQIRDLLDLQTVVPSLRISQNQSSANTSFIIRGFGNGANNIGIEPSVGVFIDGVYRSRSAAQIGDLPNLKRVEVLRGPQSTLFGKNASAGVISIVTAEPSFKFGGSGEVSYGNYNAVILRGDVTGPITDTVAFSFAGNYNVRDGYATDTNLNIRGNERDRFGVRGQLLFQPNADLKFRVIADYDRIDEVCCTVANVIDRNTSTPTGGSAPGFGAIIRAIGGRFDSQAPFSYRSSTNSPSTTAIDNYGVSLQGDWTLGNIGLTSISSYRAVRTNTAQDSDFTSADVLGANVGRNNIDTYTTEFRVASNFDGRFNFLLGGFYFNEKIDTGNSITFGRDFRAFIGGNVNGPLVVAGVPGDTILRGLEAQLAPIGIPGLSVGSLFPVGGGIFDNFRYANESYSFFGSADFKITDRLIFTGGLNYTNDAKQVSSDVRSTDAFSTLDFVAVGRTVITQGAIASTVGRTVLGLGRDATAAEVAGFAGAQPAAFAAVQAGAAAFGAANQNNPAVNPLLALRPFQFFPQFLNFPNAVENGRTRDNNVSYNLRLAWKATDNLSAYVTYATGFKASSWNLSRDSRPFPTDFIPGSPVNNPAASPIRTAGLALPNLTTGTRYANPEFARVVEGGIKGQFDRIAFNVAVFHQRITGFQGNAFVGTGFVLTNAPSESVFGMEFDGSYKIIDPLTLNFALTYLDATFDSYPGGSAYDPATLTVVPTDLSGRKVAGISPVSLSAGATYTRELSADVKLQVRGDYQYESPTSLGDGLTNLTRTVNSLNMSASLQFKNGLDITVWGRNITNAQYLTTVFPAVGGTSGLNGFLLGYPSQPVTYGGAIRYKF